MVENQNVQIVRDNGEFSVLDHCCYVREGEMNGRPGWFLFDSHGAAAMFTENRSDVFFYAHKRELKLVWLN